MALLGDKFVVVVGGTGNVGSFVVKSLLDAGARVAVPSRSQARMEELLVHLADSGTKQTRDLLPMIGDVGTEAGAAQVRTGMLKIGEPDAIIASLGTWQSAPAISAASTDQLNKVLADYLIAHFTAAKALLSSLAAKRGSYIFINGPLAFDLWPGSSLVSVATAAQHMLFRAFAKEQEGGVINVIELVNHAYIRNRETQPESTVSGEAIGRAIADLIAGAAPGYRGVSVDIDSERPLSHHE
jgi:NAD(P)-dependent dehydrogenase (short-subunit alcohol dehydrogenase family)